MFLGPGCRRTFRAIIYLNLCLRQGVRPREKFRNTADRCCPQRGSIFVMDVKGKRSFQDKRRMFLRIRYFLTNLLLVELYLSTHALYIRDNK